MEKTVIIDGQEVKLKVSGGCIRMYKLQTRRDLMRDIFKLKTLEQYMVDGRFEASEEIVSNIDFEMFMDLLWVFAKKADKSIPSPMEWEDSFTSIPFKEILPTVIELLGVLLDGAPKK